jgi:hypothetical protein
MSDSFQEGKRAENKENDVAPLSLTTLIGKTLYCTHKTTAKGQGLQFASLRIVLTYSGIKI